MKLSEILFNSVEHIWNSYLTHPFITKMADGTLEIEKFKYYMLQDYVYLKDYIKVFAIGNHIRMEKIAQVEMKGKFLLI